MTGVRIRNVLFELPSSTFVFVGFVCRKRRTSMDASDIVFRSKRVAVLRRSGRYEIN